MNSIEQNISGDKGIFDRHLERDAPSPIDSEWQPNAQRLLLLTRFDASIVAANSPKIA
jgi:hypothetical protein